MKVYVRQEESRIHNDDIKWYLANESLWITKYDNYADIEKSMGNSYGSFNWLYEVNDTLLFEKESGKIIGGQIIGFDGVDKRIDVLATAIRAHMTAFDLTELDLAYLNLIIGHTMIVIKIICTHIQKSVYAIKRLLNYQ